MEQTKDNSPNTFKIILLGETGVGKSSIIERVCSKESVKCLYDCNVELGTKNMLTEDLSVTLQFFNMIDSKNFDVFRLKGLTKKFFSDTSLVIIVFDLTHPAYIETISRWIFEVEKHHSLFQKHFRILCLGTKADLKPKKVFMMNAEPLGMELALLSKKFKQSILYYEVSSKDCDSCTKLLDQIILLAKSVITKGSSNHFSITSLDSTIIRFD